MGQAGMGLWVQQGHGDQEGISVSSQNSQDGEGEETREIPRQRLSGLC